MKNKALKKLNKTQDTRYNEYIEENESAIDEYNDGVRILDADESDEYFKAQALENEQSKSIEPMEAEILAAKVCKNNNIMLFVKLPDGQKVNVFLSVAEIKALGVALAIVPVYSTSPKGVALVSGYQVVNDKDTLKALFYGKKCTITKIEKYIITEIW